MSIPLYGQNKTGDRIDRIRGLIGHDVAATQHDNTTDAANVATITIPKGALQIGSIVKVRSCIKVIDNNGSDTSE